jgi:hypothetical protein
VRTGILASTALLLILVFILSPARFEGGSAAAVRVATAIATFTAAASGIGDFIKWIRGKPGPPVVQTGPPVVQTSRPVSAGSDYSTGLSPKDSDSDSYSMTGPPDLRDFDEKISEIRREKESAIDSQDWKRAAGLRDTERLLLIAKAQFIRQMPPGSAASRTLAWLTVPSIGAMAAQAHFLAGLQPNFECLSGRDLSGYDVADVDEYLKTARSLVAQDMAKLQAFLTAPRTFKWCRENAYSEHDVQSFLHDLDVGLATYFDEISSPPASHHPPISVEEARQEMCDARSEFIRALTPGFVHTEYVGYDTADVDKYINVAWGLAVKDPIGTVEVQAYLGMTIRNFATVKKDGYSKVGVHEYFESVHRAAKLYSSRIQQLS